MDDLIEALTILRKYKNPEFPTNCEHDILTINVKPKKVSDEDIQLLEELGVHPNYEEKCFFSYKFGSC